MDWFFFGRFMARPALKRRMPVPFAIRAWQAGQLRLNSDFGAKTLGHPGVEHGRGGSGSLLTACLR